MKCAMVKKERFMKVYGRGTLNCMEIWVDRETGVNDVFHNNGNTGGMTPLLNRDGTPVITSVHDKE